MPKERNKTDLPSWLNFLESKYPVWKYISDLLPKERNLPHFWNINIITPIVSVTVKLIFDSCSSCFSFFQSTVKWITVLKKIDIGLLPVCKFTDYSHIEYFFPLWTQLKLTIFYNTHCYKHISIGSNHGPRLKRDPEHWVIGFMWLVWKNENCLYHFGMNLHVHIL